VSSTRIVQAVARDNDSPAAAFSAETNVNLTGIAERNDGGTNTGLGGGFAVWDGAKATAGATGNTTATVTNSINAFLTIALMPNTALPGPAPVYQAVNTATSELNWPVHAIDDVALLFVETGGGEVVTLTVPNGFSAVPNSPQATGITTAGTRMTAFWARATSAAMPGPTLTVPTVANSHIYARIITYRGVSNTGNPWDVTGGGVKAAASTAVSVTGVTTTVPNTRIVQAVARDNDSTAAAFSAETNVNLTGILERNDAGTTTGLGGGFAVWDGAKATAGATGITTATVTNSINAFLTIALRPPVAGPDHYELSLPATGVACLASTVTVTACADASSPCTNLFAAANGTIATLATSAGEVDLTPVTFDATGVATTTLSYPAATDGATATVTLSGEALAATNLRKCCQNGVCAVADSCATTFNTAAFIISGSAGGAVASIPTQTAGTTSGSYYLRAVKTNTTTQACEAALSAPSSVNLGYTCNNPSTCSTGNLLDITPYNGVTPQTTQAVAPVSSAVDLYFDANGNAPFTFNYQDVGQISINASKAAGGTLLTVLTGSTNAFVTAPGGFVLSGILQTALPNLANPGAADAGGSKFVTAGEAFSVTVTATTSGGATTPNYGQENLHLIPPANVPESVKLNPALLAGLGLTNTPAIGGTFGTFTNGVATGTAFTWSEVGIIKLTPSVGDGDYLGAGDASGTQSGNVGRFSAAKFALSGGAITNRTALSGCTSGCGTFTYMDEQMSAVLSLTAKALDGTTTLQNYNYSATAANNFAKLDPTAAGNPLALAAVDTGTPRTAVSLDTATYGVASGNFVGGAAAITVPFAVTRGGSASGPFDALDVGVNPADNDGATLATWDLAVNAGGIPNTHGKVGTSKARYGQLRLSNAHGSELLRLLVNVFAQYWDGTTYINNLLDFNSTFAATDVVLSNPQVNLLTSETNVITPPVSVVFIAGVGSYRLAAPGVGNNGSVDMTVNSLGLTYLPSNTSRATFGVYKGNNEFIYLREAY
jgi:MSHA biogenesis protein MshQ